MNLQTRTLSISEQALLRFINRIIIDEDGCWIFDGPPGYDGYGQFMVDYKNMGAHVFSYLAFVADEIKPNMDVAHACDKKLCVTPQCLSQKTRVENVQEAIERGQFKRGEHRTVQAKLSYEKAEQIRQLRKEGFTYTKLASMFGVGPGVCWQVVNNITWVRNN